MTHDNWMTIQGFIMGFFSAYWLGHAIGQKVANLEYRQAMQDAKKDYKEATRQITSLRNRLMAARWLKRRAAKIAKGGDAGR